MHLMIIAIMLAILPIQDGYIVTHTPAQSRIF